MDRMLVFLNSLVKVGFRWRLVQRNLFSFNMRFRCNLDLRLILYRTWL